ncbi:MAG: hypothetical protein RIS70_1883 [Planctomycetota bacterium]
MPRDFTASEKATAQDRGLLGRELSRRALFRSVVCGAGCLSLPLVLQLQSVAAPNHSNKKRSLILLWQDGGPSHFETFDPKPDAPSEYRGEMAAIQTSLPGISYCEVLPRLAQLAHLTTVIRSLHQPSSDHVVGSHNVLTGWYDQTSGGRSRYPDLASVISHMRSGAEDAETTLGASTDPRIARGMRAVTKRATAADRSADLPRYIDIGMGLHRGGPAFLGPVDGPFQVAGDPAKPGFTIQNLEASSSIDRLRSRAEILASLDRLNGSAPSLLQDEASFRALDGFRRQALELVTGGAAARAFDLSREPIAHRERYGFHLAGQQCLLARRLVEAGVGVVAVRFSPDGRGDYDRTMIGWDDHAVHGNIFTIMRQRGPQFDQSVSALIEDLEQRGMRDEVLVVVAGEFGRTPRVHVHKGCPGREHWGPAGCALVYGGGFAMGQVVGSTNSLGETPQDRPVTYQDLLATIYESLGIPLSQTFVNETGRPVPLLPAGQPIAELTSGTRRTAANDDRRPSQPLNRELPHNPDFAVVLPRNTTADDIRRRSDRGQWLSLAMQETRVDDRALESLSECRTLRRLSLNGLPITDAGLVHLSTLSTLEELVLTGTQVTDAGLASLRSLRNLRRLAINGTGISIGGIVELFVSHQQRTLIDALAALHLVTFDEHHSPVAIDVAGTSFSDAELRHLNAVPSLRELHLAATRVTDQGLTATGSLDNLERLFLAKCDITDAGLASISRFPRLQALNLVGTKITSAGLAHLAELRDLRSLLITDLKLSPAAVEQLKGRLPQLTVSDFTPV